MTRPSPLWSGVTRRQFETLQQSHMLRISLPLFDNVRKILGEILGSRSFRHFSEFDDALLRLEDLAEELLALVQRNLEKVDLAERRPSVQHVEDFVCAPGE